MVRSITRPSEDYDGEGELKVRKKESERGIRIPCGSVKRIAQGSFSKYPFTQMWGNEIYLKGG